MKVERTSGLIAKEQRRPSQADTSTCGKWERWERPRERRRWGPDRQTPSLVVTSSARRRKTKRVERKLKRLLTCVFYQHSKPPRKKINSQPMNSAYCSRWRKTEIAVIILIMVFTHTHTGNAATRLCVNINTHTPVESMPFGLHKANLSARKATLGSCRGLDCRRYHINVNP